MYCRNCAKELIGVPYYCMNCGARPLAGNRFCPSCANPTTPLSEICVKCGIMLVASATTTAPPPKFTRKKTVSVLLAVFLHFFTWAYTYEKDRWKFWTALAIWLFMLMTIAAQIGPAGWLMALAVWIWAIVDVVRKPDSWYREELITNS